MLFRYFFSIITLGHSVISRLDCNHYKKKIKGIHNTTLKSKLVKTRKYLLRWYILGVLTHTTAWDQHWGGDETLKTLE